MNFIRQNTPFVLKWDIELQGTAIKLADTKVSVIASCARGRIDLTDYIDSIEENTITIKQNKGLAFIGDYSLMAIIESENLTTLKVQEKYVFRAIAKNDPTETESLVSIRSSIVASGGYDSALSEVSQNAIQNAPVAKEFGKVYQAIEDTENSIKQSVEDVLGGASEAYDTLKEIEEYIEKDEAGAVALAQSITRLETEKVSKEDIDSALSTESENPVQNKVITAALNEKVDKVSGKGLSTNDYTTSEKDKLASLENYDDSEIKSQLTELSDRIDNLPQKEGNYPLLHVGTADDLAGRGESVPAEFGFRASGGKSIKDGRAYIKAIKGNSVVWNQKVKGFVSWNLQGGTIEGNEAVWSAESRTGVLNAHSNTFAQHTTHKYLISADVKASSTNVGLGIYFTNSPIVKHTGSGNYESLAIITNGKGDGVDACYLTDVDTSGYSEIRAKNYRCIDLTQMFQAGNEPNTIEEFNARVATLGIDMYAYNEGQVIHCNTKSIKSIGDNALNADRSLVFDFDGSYGNYDFINTEDAFVGLSADGYINNGAIDYAEKIECGFRFRSNGGGYGIGLFVKALPNEEYSVSYASDNGRITFGFYDKGKNLISYELWGNRFTTPSNCEYIMLCLRDNEVINVDISFTDIMLTLVHSGWKQDTDAGYQPYWEDTLPLPIIRKYFPDGMKSAGSAHDEIRFNKTTKKWEYSKGKIKSVDLGDLDWSYYPAADGYPYGFFYANPQGRNYGENNILCGKYAFGFFVDDKSIMGNTSGENIYIMDSAYTDAEALKASLQGVILYYESNDWEWVELDEADQNFRDYYNVADFGTEMSQSNNVPSAAFSADIIYQFNAVDMIREHEIEINELQDAIKAMQAQLTSLINGGQ